MGSMNVEKMVLVGGKLVNVYEDLVETNLPLFSELTAS
jgi:hypothetical protein